MTDTYPYLAPGDEVALDLVTGLSGLTGEVVGVDLAPGGTWRCLSIRQDGQEHPLRIKGELVAVWRLGKPVPRQLPQGIQVPVGGLPPGLLDRGPNGRQS
jgi:hypothetical protein